MDIVKEKQRKWKDKLARARQVKWPTGAPIWLPLEFCTFAKRLLYDKTCYK